MMERALFSLEMRRLKAENNLYFVLIPMVKKIEESGKRSSD